MSYSPHSPLSPSTRRGTTVTTPLAAREGHHMRGSRALGQERLIITLGPKEFGLPTAQGQGLADQPQFRQAFVDPCPHLLWRRAL